MKPCYCINPSCQQPDHPHNNNAQTKYCVSCGSTLLLNNKYRVSRLLSDNSGFGIIYEAFDGFDGKILKVLQERWNSEAKAVALFKREYDVLLALTQQNVTGIPQAEAYFQYQNREGKLFYCLVMEKVEGIDLEQWIQQDNKLHQKQALNWLREVTLILDKVHQQNWFHRDIKPPNIMKRNNGELVLIDFGTAREETQTYYQNLQGQRLTGITSAGYTPNEQQYGQSVVQSDFFALGRTFVHLLTGQHPSDLYDAVNDELRWRDKVENIDTVFLDLIDNLMKRLPKDRPENTQVILERLDKIEKQLQQQKQVPKPQPPVTPNPPQTPVISPQPPASPNINHYPAGSPVNVTPKSPIKPQKSKNNRLRNGLIAIGGILLLLAGYPSYIFWRYGFSLTNPLLLSVDSDQFLDKTLTGHSGNIISIAYSPDGKYLASSSRDDTIKIWQVETGREVHTLSDHSDDIHSIAYSPDGHYLASGSDDDTIKIWHVATGQEVQTLSGHSDDVYSVGYSPDTKHLVSGSKDFKVKIWEIATEQEISTLTGHSDTVNSVEYSPDGRYLASTSYDGTIKIWDVLTRKELHTLTGNPDASTGSRWVNILSYSPDAKYLASPTQSGSIQIWEVATGTKISSLTGHSSGVTLVAYSPDGKYLASSSNDKTIKIWDVETGEEIRTLTGHSDWVVSVVYSPDGKYLASGSWDKTIKIWRVGR